MNYSNEIKPAQVLNLSSLDELSDNVFMTRDNDTAYYSIKKPENNANRYVFNMETSGFNIEPTVRIVNCTNKNKKYTGYQSFVIETKDKSNGIAVVLMKLEDPKTFYYNIRILPLNTLGDIADSEADSKLLTVNLDKANCILKTDIVVSPSNTGEAMYAAHDIDVSAVSNLISDAETIELQRELEFQGAKLIAHFTQKILDIVLNENPASSNNLPMLSEDYILKLSDIQLKDLLLANAISGNIAIEIIGANVIKLIDSDWTDAGAFLQYLI